ncbi:MAG: hypothetical protein ACE5H2_04650 [Terriglobia bacterium]
MHRSLRLWVLLLAGLAMLSTPGPVGAGEPQAYSSAQAGRVEVQGVVGYAGFVDEAFIDLPHYVAGGGIRVYLTDRVSLQPEFLYMYRSSDDQDFVFIPNVAFDLTGQNERVMPYVVWGIGILHHRGRFFSGSTWTPSGGIGVKVFLTDRMFVSPEVRAGWEPFLRVTVGIGYVLTRGRK